MKWQGTYQSTRSHAHLNAILAPLDPSRLILRLANYIDPDWTRTLDWYASTPLREFNNLTAKQLVETDQAHLVVTFLYSILRGARDR